MEAFQRRGTGYLLPPRHQARREKARRLEEEEEEVEQVCPVDTLCNWPSFQGHTNLLLLPVLLSSV
jgi:hypothetical protein